METGPRGTVFITHDAGNMDFIKANDWGRNVIAMATRNLPMWSDPAPALGSIRNNMLSYDPAVDFILLAGDPAIIGYCIHIAMERAKRKRIPEVKMLKWNRKGGGQYQLLKIPVL